MVKFSPEAIGRKLRLVSIQRRPREEAAIFDLSAKIGYFTSNEKKKDKNTNQNMKHLNEKLEASLSFHLFLERH